VKVVAEGPRLLLRSTPKPEKNKLKEKPFGGKEAKPGKKGCCRKKTRGAKKNGEKKKPCSRTRAGDGKAEKEGRTRNHIRRGGSRTGKRASILQDMLSHKQERKKKSRLVKSPTPEKKRKKKMGCEKNGDSQYCSKPESGEGIRRGKGGVHLPGHSQSQKGKCSWGRKSPMAKNSRKRGKLEKKEIF